MFLIPRSLFLVPSKRNLGAGNRPKAPGAGALGKLHSAVEAIVVGEGEGVIPQLERAQDELVDVGGTFEKGEVGVGVEFGVGRHSSIIRTPVLLIKLVIALGSVNNGRHNLAL